MTLSRFFWYIGNLLLSIRQLWKNHHKLMNMKKVSSIIFTAYWRDINKLSFRYLTWSFMGNLIFLAFLLEMYNNYRRHLEDIVTSIKKYVGIILRACKNRLITCKCYNSQFLSVKLRFWTFKARYLKLHIIIYEPFILKVA